MGVGARFEKLVMDLLPALGLSPKTTRLKIFREGVEVGEVDIVAIDEKGDTYAIEVKAGKVDISGVRQAYVNAMLMGAKPLVIARGYADEGARQLAKELGVEVVLLPDYIFLSLDDLYTAFASGLARFFKAVLSLYTNLYQYLDYIKECQDMECICKKVNCDELFKKLPKEARNIEMILLVLELHNAMPMICEEVDQCIRFLNSTNKPCGSQSRENTS